MTAAEQFAAAAGRPLEPALIAQVEAALAACVAAQPELEVDAGAFAAHLGVHCAGGLPGDPLILDLHLAFAAAHRGSAALVRFERDVLPAATAALRALGIAAPSIDDALQRVREKLVVGGGDGRPRLLDYRGQGRLRAWVRVIAVREQLMAQRGRDEPPLCDAVLAAVPDPNDDPALGYLRQHYRSELAAALAEATAGLTVRERTLLRYSLVDGLTLDEIGSIYRTHKSTASRWLARARTHLWEATRAALSTRIDGGTAEIESVIRAVRTGLDLSLERLLSPEGD